MKKTLKKAPKNKKCENCDGKMVLVKNNQVQRFRSGEIVKHNEFLECEDCHRKEPMKGRNYSEKRM